MLVDACLHSCDRKTKKMNSPENARLGNGTYLLPPSRPLLSSISFLFFSFFFFSKIRKTENENVVGVRRCCSMCAGTDAIITPNSPNGWIHHTSDRLRFIIFSKPYATYDTVAFFALIYYHKEQQER